MPATSAAKLFRVWGTREVAGRIGWTRCVISAPLPVWLLFRPVHPGFMSLNQAAEKLVKRPRGLAFTWGKEQAKALGSAGQQPTGLRYSLKHVALTLASIT